MSTPATALKHYPNTTEPSEGTVIGRFDEDHVYVLWGTDALLDDPIDRDMAARVEHLADPNLTWR